MSGGRKISVHNREMADLLREMRQAAVERSREEQRAREIEEFKRQVLREAPKWWRR
jgi:hypothetical protein